MTIWSLVQIVLISVFVLMLCGMIFEIVSQKKMIRFSSFRWANLFVKTQKNQLQEPKLSPISDFSNFSEIELVRPPKLQSQPDHLMIIHVMAQQGRYFSGAALKLALQATHLHYGDLKIFHYHEFPGGVGPIWFSLVSAVEPGVFDLERLEISFTPGVSLFLSHQDIEQGTDNIDFSARFEMMLKTAKQLALRLGGELLDHEYRVLSLDQIMNYRQTVAAWRGTDSKSKKAAALV